MVCTLVTNGGEKDDKNEYQQSPPVYNDAKENSTSQGMPWGRKKE